MTGTLKVATAPVDERDKVVPVVIAFQANMAKPPDVAWGAIAFALALLIGIGVPVAMLYLVKWRNAKIPPVQLQGDTISVAITPDTVLRDGTPFALRTSDVRSVVPIRATGARDINVGSVQLRTHTGWSPLGPGTVQASRAGSRAASSTHGANGDGTATLPLAVHNSWVLLRPEGSSNGEVLLLLGDDPTGEVRARMADEIRSRGPGLWRRLGSGEQPTGGDPDPFTTPGAGAPADPFGAPAGSAQADPFSSSPWAPPPTAVVPPPGSTTAAGSLESPGSVHSGRRTTDVDEATIPPGSSGGGRSGLRPLAPHEASTNPVRELPQPPDFSTWSLDDM